MCDGKAGRWHNFIYGHWYAYHNIYYPFIWDVFCDGRVLACTHSYTWVPNLIYRYIYILYRYIHNSKINIGKIVLSEGEKSALSLLTQMWICCFRMAGSHRQDTQEIYYELYYFIIWHLLNMNGAYKRIFIHSACIMRTFVQSPFRQLISNWIHNEKLFIVCKWMSGSLHFIAIHWNWLFTDLFSGFIVYHDTYWQIDETQSRTNSIRSVDVYTVIALTINWNLLDECQ